MEKFIKIIIADDKALWRKRLIQELAPFGIECIAEALNGQDLLEKLGVLKPDVVLLDLRMPVMDGNHTMTLLQKEHPRTKAIIMSMHDEEELINDYMARGAKAYLSKDNFTIDVLANTIRQVAAGTYVQKARTGAEKYSVRQLEMIPMLCEGMTNKEIAKEIGITEWGVEKQRQKIYAKTGAKRAVDFYKAAFLQGLDFLGRSSRKKE